jgi:putative resolvase
MTFMEKNYSPREAAAILGIAVHTIQVWDRQGRIRCVRLPSGRRRIPESEVKRLLNVKEERKDAVYARVLSSEQERDFEKQMDILKDISEKRIAKLYVTHEDRLARIGFELISWVCEKYGTEIVPLEDKEYASFREERARDLVSLITAFSAKLFGLRSHRTKRILEAVNDALVQGT